MFYEETNNGEVWHPWHFVLVLALILALGWGLTAALWGMRVATAGIVGAGQAHIQKESAPNRIFQQAFFETAWADIRKYDVQVKDATAAVADWDKVNAGKADNAIGTLANERARLASIATGIRQQCQTTVENYNAAARQYLARDFRAADLPEEIKLTSHCN